MNEHSTLLKIGERSIQVGIEPWDNGQFRASVRLPEEFCGGITVATAFEVTPTDFGCWETGSGQNPDAAIVDLKNNLLQNRDLVAEDG